MLPNLMSFAAIAQPLKTWWWARTSELARRLGRSQPPYSRTQPSRVRAGQLLWLDSAMANPLAREALRDHLADCQGAEHLEFLVACSGFQDASNPLQRYQQLRSIIDRFVRDGAERPVPLPQQRREQLLSEWAHWSDGNRLPMHARLRGLDAAVVEVRRLMRSRGRPKYVQRS